MTVSVLELLRLEIANVQNPDAAEPEKPVGKDDFVLDELNDEMKRIYSLARQYYFASRRDIDDDEEQGQSQDDYLQAMSLQDKSNLFQNLLSESCRNAFPDMSKYRGVHVRKGWKLVGVELVTDDTPVVFLGGYTVEILSEEEDKKLDDLRQQVEERDIFGDEDQPPPPPRTKKKLH